MREPADSVYLSPSIAGKGTRIDFLLIELNSNLTAKELSDKSKAEKKKKQTLTLKGLFH